MKNLNETQKFDDLRNALKDVQIRSTADIERDALKAKNPINAVLMECYSAMSEKGYNPVNQFVGYIISGDPTYITSYKDARKKIAKLERDEILEEIIEYYINNNF